MNDETYFQFSAEYVLNFSEAYTSATKRKQVTR